MKRIFCLGTLVAIFATFSFAAEPIVIKVWPDGAPTSNGATAENPASGGQAWDFEPILTVYPAENPNGLAILGCPGGGYYMLSNSHECKMFHEFYNSIGITFACVDYRMPGGHKDVPLSDVQQAMRIMKAHAAEWKFDKLGIMGASAGGHVASTAATHYVDDVTKPDFQILFYPVISMDAAITHASSREFLIGKEPSNEDITLFSNELQVNKETPKAFIIHCTDDNVVPVENSIRYYQALVANGVSATMHIYPKGGHGFGILPFFSYNAEMKAEITRWVDVELLGKQPEGMPQWPAPAR